MIEYFYKTLRDDHFHPLPAIREGCWIHVDEATNEDLVELCRLTGLELLDLQDALDKYEVPRVEKMGNQTFLFARYPTEQELGLYTFPFTIILASHYFITISPQKNPLIQNFLLERKKLSTLQKPKLLIQLLMRISHEFSTQIKKVRHNVLAQEKEIINVDSEDITALTRNEEVLNQYQMAIAPLRGALQKVTSGKVLNLYEQEQSLLEDLLNAIKQSEDVCESNLKSIRSLRDSYQIIFTNNLHKTIKLLTSLTIIFSIPTMIASLYGMNVTLPFANDPYFILFMILVLSLAGLFFFHRKKWL
jgi:magnesium transporter